MVQVPEHLRARVDALVAQRRRALLDKVAATEREIRGLQDAARLTPALNGGAG